MRCLLFNWLLLLLWGIVRVEVASGLTCPKYCICTERPDELTDINCRIPSSVSGLEPNAFANLHSINDLIIRGASGIIHTGAFNGISGNPNSSVVIINYSRTITSIKPRAFNNIYNLLGIKIRYSDIVTVESEAFYNLNVFEIAIDYSSVDTIQPYSFYKTTMDKFRISYSDFVKLDSYAFSGMEGVNDIYFGYSDIYLIKENCFRDLKDGDRFRFAYSSIFLLEKYAFGLRNFSSFEITYSEVLHMETMAFMGTADIHQFQISYSDFFLVSNFAFYGLHDTDAFEILSSDVICCGKHALSGINVTLNQGNDFPIPQQLDAKAKPPTRAGEARYKCNGSGSGSFLEYYQVPNEGLDRHHTPTASSTKVTPAFTTRFPISDASLTSSDDEDLDGQHDRESNSKSNPANSSGSDCPVSTAGSAQELILYVVVGVLCVIISILVITVGVILRKLRNSADKKEACPSAAELTLARDAAYERPIAHRPGDVQIPDGAYEELDLPAKRT